jgi:hypothetical protein
MNALTTGNNNTGAGYNTMYVLTSGSGNTCVGYQAGFNLTTGSNNIYINHSGVSTETGTIRIGNATDHTACYIAGITGRSVTGGTAVYVGTDGKLGPTASSLRYKKNVTDMENTDYFYNLRPVNFEYKTDNIKRFGFIAEETEQVNPLFVRYAPDDNDLQPDYNDMYADENDLDENGQPIMKPKMKGVIKPDGLNEQNLMMVAMKCIIEQKKEIEEMKLQIQALQTSDESIKTAPRMSDVMAKSLVPIAGQYLAYESTDTNELKIAFGKADGAISYAI